MPETPANVELKAAYDDHDSARRVLSRLGGVRKGLEEQVDTYYCVPEGRFKLREIAGAAAELIYYQRNESGGRRDCRYRIFRTNDPEALKGVLERALGVDARVEKTREVYHLDKVKVNLDEVHGLGRFVEFEVPADEGFDAAERMVRELKEEFSVEDDAVVGCSYCDLVKKGGTSTRTG